MRKLSFLLIGLLIGLLAGCGTDTADRSDSQPAPAVDRTVLNDPNMVLLPSGVRYLDLEEGTGEEIVHGAYVQWDFSLFLTDDTGLVKLQALASSLNKPEEYYRGQAGVTGLPGLTEGVLGMKAGGTRRIHVPWELGWGEEGPLPKQNLIFEVRDIQLISRAEAEEWQRKEHNRREYIEDEIRRREDSLSQNSVSREAAHGH